MKFSWLWMLSCLALMPPVAGQDKTRPLAASNQTVIRPATKPQPKAKPQPETGPRYDDSVPAPTLAEVWYGDHGRQVLDFWKAPSLTPSPLVLIVHGGGWRGGSKERVDRFADVAALLDAGISVVAINYRFTTQAAAAEIEPPVKAPLGDAARALQYIRSRSEQWNLDPTRIGAAGGSAGACTSLWLAFHDDLADPTSDDPVSRQSTRLACAAVTGAQTSLDPRQMREWTPNSKYGGHAFGLPDFAAFLSKRESILPWIAEYSPYALVSRDDPPICLTYSRAPAIGQVQKDPTHTSNFGVKLQEHCRAVSVPCELVYPDAPEIVHATPTDFLIAMLNEKETQAGE